MRTVRTISAPHQRRVHGFRFLSSPKIGWFVLLGTITVLILGIGWYFDSPPPPNRPYALLTGICLVISLMPVVLGITLLAKPLVGSIFKRIHHRAVRRWMYNTLHTHLVSLLSVKPTFEAWMKSNTSTFYAVLCIASTLVSLLLFLVLVSKIGKEIGRRTPNVPAQSNN